jgi:hypothetical protein
MKILPLLFTAALLHSPTALLADNKHTQAPAFDPTLPWITDFNLALDQSRKSGKPILAEFR